jgi:hypothetical protein
MQDNEALMQGWWLLSNVSDGPAKKAALGSALEVAETMDRNHQISEGNAGVIETLRQQLTALDSAKGKPGP